MNNRPPNEVVEVSQTSSTNMMLDDELLKMGGAGKENVTAKDVLIPRLTILQALSPQVQKKKAEYIEGAEVGDFCNVATGDIYKEEILVIPVHFASTYIEWAKNRGGLIANHGDNPSVLDKTIRNERNENVLPNGNVINETAQWYCLLQDGATWTRVFLPLSKTNLKHSRKWLTLTNAEGIPQSDNTIWKPPLFWRSWKLIIIDDSNDQGNWNTFRPEKGELTMTLDPSRQLIRLCKSFYEDIRGNVVKADLETGEYSGGPTINATATSSGPVDDDIPF